MTNGYWYGLKVSIVRGDTVIEMEDAVVVTHEANRKQKSKASEESLAA
jgi:uncharacterized membrane protein